MKRPHQLLLNNLGVKAGFGVTSLPGNENENYLVRTDGASFVVKKLRGHSAANTELEGVYRRYLVDSGLPVIPYIALKDESYVLTADGDNYVAAPYKDGRMATPTEELVREAAVLLAKVHSLDATGMPKRQSWYRQSYISDSLNLISDDYLAAKKLFVLQRSNTPDFWNSNLPTGIIHGDLQEENIIVDTQNKIISVIDWEEAAIEPLLLDVAHTAQQLTFVDSACNRKLFDVFVDAYQSVRPLSSLEKTLFAAALQYTILVLSVWAHTKVSQKQMDEAMFRRVGSYYKTNYVTPRIQ